MYYIYIKRKKTMYLQKDRERDAAVPDFWTSVLAHEFWDNFFLVMYDVYGMASCILIFKNKSILYIMYIKIYMHLWVLLFGIMGASLNSV